MAHPEERSAVQTCGSLLCRLCWCVGHWRGRAGRAHTYGWLSPCTRRALDAVSCRAMQRFYRRWRWQNQKRTAVA
eukprot:4902250-Prymnesium_polylepis.1